MKKEEEERKKDRNHRAKILWLLYSIKCDTSYC